MSAPWLQGTGTEDISRPLPTFTAARLTVHRQPQPEEICVVLHAEGGDGELGRGRLGRASILVRHVGEVLSYRELVLERSGRVRLPPDRSFLRPWLLLHSPTSRAGDEPPGGAPHQTLGLGHGEAWAL